MNVVDLLNGVIGSQGCKAPVLAKSSGNVVLYGLQNLGGVQTVENMRVMVGEQNDPIENGLYNASTGYWTRCADFDGANDAANGTLVILSRPNVQAVLYVVAAVDPVVIGTSAITFAPLTETIVTDTGVAKENQLRRPGGDGAAAALIRDSSVVVIGDSIAGGLSATSFRRGWSWMFCRSIMNHFDKGPGSNQSAGYHTIADMFSQNSEGDIVTDGTMTGGLVWHWTLAAGKKITVTNKQCRWIDLYYKASASTGNIEWYRNGVLIATKEVTPTSDFLQTTAFTAVANLELCNLDDVFEIKATGTLVVYGVTCLKTVETSPSVFQLALGGTGFQDWNTAAAMDEIAYYMNAFRIGYPNILVTELGTNNIYAPSKVLTPAQVVSNMQTLVAGIRARVFNPIFVFVIPPKPNEALWPIANPAYTWQNYVDAMVEYCYANFHEMVRLDKSRLSFDTSLYADGLHPADVGHAIYADAACKAIGIPLNPQLPLNNNLSSRDDSGTFFPRLKGLTDIGVGTYTRQVGKYTKMGKTVFFTIDLAWTAHTGTGFMSVDQLPFAPSPYISQMCTAAYNGLTVAAGKGLCGLFVAGQTQINLAALDPAGGAVAFVAMDTTVASLIITGFYITD